MSTCRSNFPAANPATQTLLPETNTQAYLQCMRKPGARFSSCLLAHPVRAWSSNVIAALDNVARTDLKTGMTTFPSLSSRLCDIEGSGFVPVDMIPTIGTESRRPCFPT